MIKKFPILYSRTSKGQIQQWQIFYENDRFWTVEGIKDGQLTTSKPTICTSKNEGKANETSPDEQSLLEASAKFKKKLEADYHLDVKDIDKERFIPVMLAHKWEDYKNDVDWSNGVYVSPKMDGLRAVITEKSATSRNGKVFVSFPHILRELQSLLKNYPGLALDGEIYCDRLNNNFEKIISLAKKTKPTSEDLVESEKYLEYHIFDSPTIEGNFHNRFTYLRKLILDNLPNNKWIKVCKHTLITSSSEIEEKLQEYIAAGYEGLMLNTYEGEYQGKRSKHLLKYKLFFDIEAEITGIIEGTGGRSGMFGYAQLKLKNGKTFDANARGDEELYRNILKNKSKLVGKMATVRYQNLTSDGIPRFPVIVDFNRFD